MRQDVARAARVRLGRQWRVEPFDDSGLHLLLTPRDGVTDLTFAGAWDEVAHLRQLRGVVYAEPLFAYCLPAHPGEGAAVPAHTTGLGAATPATPEWSLEQMRVPEAWNRFFGGDPLRAGAGIRIGHPDTGYTDHPELLPGLALEQSWDFLKNDANSRDELEQAGLPPNPGHGTSTASVIVSPPGRQLASPGPNFVTGVAPGARVVPLRVTHSVVLLSMLNLANSLEHAAVQAGAHVISISLGGLGSWYLRQKVLRAVERGVIVVAAAGNYVGFVVWPAAYPEVIAVAASTVSRTAWEWSSSGSRVDVTAPGAGVWQAQVARQTDGTPVMGVGQANGTSLGTAAVAGLAALWLSYHGREALITRYGAAGVPRVFQYLLRASCDPTPDFVRGGRFGAGIVDAVRLLETQLPDPGAGVPDFRLLSRVLRDGGAHSPLDQGGVAGFTHLYEPPVTLGEAAPALRDAIPSIAGAEDPTIAGLLAGLLGVSPAELPAHLDLVGRELAAHLSFSTPAHPAAGTQGPSGGDASDRRLSSAREQFQEAVALRRSATSDTAERAEIALAACRSTLLDGTLSEALRERLTLSAGTPADRRNRTTAADVIAAPLVSPEPPRRANDPSPAELERLRLARKVAELPPPSLRRLHVYSFDPSLKGDLETAAINRATVEVPWEDLEPGPVGEYLEVVDVDPPSRCCYTPVDLNHPHVLARDGLDPSEGSPQFHQQMVYAVAMTTIRHFEQALGRRVLWAPHRSRDQHGAWNPDEFVRRLRLYPHALREANAYYSPDKKALLFGYFPAGDEAPGKHYPGGMVFTCLSHDIIAHEITHALLDGLHRRFIEATNPDVLAFHEAFADLVALFQHFTLTPVLRREIARSRGELRTNTLLGQLAQQFGQAIGGHGALRDAIGGYDKATREWRLREPNPDDLRNVFEPHARGAILVGAVFDAFLAIYNTRIQDLVRLASGGSGVLPLGQIAPDLVDRLAEEAAKTARHMLNMCVRALDYLPPVDVTFGDYLRALITADYDLVPDDPLYYRTAVIQAFRRRGIYPEGLRTLAEDTLRWRRANTRELDPARLDFAAGLKEISGLWTLRGDGTDNLRERIHDRAHRLQGRLKRWFDTHPEEQDSLLGLGLDLTRSREGQDGKPRWPVEVHAIRPARRVSPHNETLTDLVIVVTQWRRAALDPQQPEGASFPFRGGVTLIVDQETAEVRYAIHKAIGDPQREQRQRDFLLGKSGRLGVAALSAWDGAGDADYDMMLRRTYLGERDAGEPFALLHRSAPRAHPAEPDPVPRDVDQQEKNR